MKRLIIVCTILSIAGLASPASAQFTVSGDVNYSTNSESVGGNVEVGYWVQVAPRIYLTPNARYRVNENSTSAFSANAEARVDLPKTSDFYPYLGGGLTYYRTSATRNAFDDLSADRTGFSVLGGAHFKAGNARPYVQARYIVGDNFDDFNIEAGVRYTFRKTVQ